MGLAILACQCMAAVLAISAVEQARRSRPPARFICGAKKDRLSLQATPGLRYPHRRSGPSILGKKGIVYAPLRRSRASGYQHADRQRGQGRSPSRHDGSRSVSAEKQGRDYCSAPATGFWPQAAGGFGSGKGGNSRG